MGIHTCEVSAQILIDEDCIYEDMSSILLPFGFTEEMITDLAYIKNKNVYYTVSLASDYPDLGLKSISVFRSKYMVGFILIIQMNLNVLIGHKNTIDVFIPNKENNQLLSESFREAMSQFCPYEDMCTLEGYKCRRIDYTYDFRFNDDNEKALFYHLAHKTSKMKWNRKRKLLPKKECKNIYDQSAAEKNKSSKAILYDKFKEIEENHNLLPERKHDFLLEEASNIIRFELQCEKSKVRYLKQSLNFTGRELIWYLDEKLERSLLLKTYEDTVGVGDFYNLESAVEKLNEAGISSRLRNNLIKFLKLIAQSQSLSKGKSHFISKSGGRLKGNNTIVKGSLGTYYRYIRELGKMNINPMLIPKHKSDDYNIQILHNPIDELIIEQDETPVEEQVPV